MLYPFSLFTKEILMASSNQGKGGNPGTQGGTPQQHVEAGRQSSKNDDSKGASASKGKSGSSTQGGTPEQHAEAGRQSHKNDKK